MASIQLMNIVFPSQELYLRKIGTRVKVWLEGNQHSAYTVNGAFLVQGSVSVAVTVNGHTSFQVPALGRWSDEASTTRFTLPGTVYLNFVVRGEVLIIDSSALASGSGATIPPEWKPQVVSGVEYNAVTNSLVANYYALFNPSPYSAQYYINTSISGGASVQILEAMTSYITTFGATCSQTLNTLSSTVTLNETYEEPYELQYCALRYYVSEIAEGTATVCIDAVDCHAWTDTFWANAEQLAAEFAYLYNSWTAENFATSVGTKCYVTLTAEQVASQIALWEESSPPVVSNAPNIVAGFLLPFFILRAVFDDPSTVEGEYDSPVLVKTTEVTSMATITVSDNSQIAAGDTLTNNVGGIPFVYTFRNLPTGAANEIIIGGTAAITAANIATALNATDGAIFTATASSGVVSVTEYTSETVTKTTTSAGITIGDVIQTVIYTTPDPVATLPAFTSNGLCSDGTGFLPKFTGAGTCTQDDFCIGRGVLPAATCNAQSFITGVSYSSTDAEKISLLLNGNGFMQNFAPMVCVSDPDEAALLAVQFAANYITHTSDVIVWGTTESWVCPRATLYYAQGDCEDGAFLIASLLLNIGVSSSKVKVAIGYYDDTGHAWAMYQRASDGIWVNLDWTKGSTYWNAISSVDELPIAFSEA